MKKNNKVQIELTYGNGVVAIPEKVLESLGKLSETDLKVLILIPSDIKYRTDKAVSELAGAIGCDEGDVENSLSLLSKLGIISYNTDGLVKKQETKTQATSAVSRDIPKRVKIAEIPQYTTKEMNDLLKLHSGTVELIDECQNIIGKIFTAADIKVLIGLIDYLGFDNDYILVLMHFAAKNEQKSMHYIQKLAVSCFDDGFTDAAELQKELYAREERNAIESKIKNIFGIGTRKLTTKEKAQITAWISEYKFELDVIEKAYDITVGATAKPSVFYANAILEGWYKDGIRNIDDVNALREKYEQEKNASNANNSSFSVDDFFDAALKRSYSEK